MGLIIHYALGICQETQACRSPAPLPAWLPWSVVYGGQVLFFL
jgi:hypothetical protein